MLATGVGEVLERVSDMPPCALVIAIGEKGISTPQAYAALDEKYNFFNPATPADSAVHELIDLWQNDALSASCTCFYNIFEDVVAREKPDVTALREAMLRCGALVARMSGSGPSVFGIFATESEAEGAKEALLQMGADAFVCKPFAQNFL